MATLLPQTKRKIDALLATGVKRSDFRVRTSCNHKGEYQKTEITLFGWDAQDIVIENYPTLAETEEFDFWFICSEQDGNRYMHALLSDGCGRVKITYIYDNKLIVDQKL